ncbi:PQQ-binding-like beta-propeller repeat protein [Arthrobacter sp. VKM Ac-2550]|uniref:outer membrane protein assembly factor BamB family protein n=1 Tax=Crystallibacter permensis TaxID=1938888 RepID=UPI00222799BF|nr:PQQ-binding-like beta-propeller repeat protein [Arthrobacter sp. VKM Ac-2550]MCW2134484.1 PQQ-like domain-containing protein [Arthrobacter sp. VKM Ac-2550]
MGRTRYSLKTTLTALMAPALAGALLAGCSADVEASSAEGSAAAQAAENSRPAEELWSTKLNVVGQPQVKDGTAFVYVSDGRKLELAAVDVATGKIQWKHAASPGDDYVGNPPYVAFLEQADGKNLVAFIAPGDFSYPTIKEAWWPWLDRVQIRNIDTGDIVHNTGGMVVDQSPEVCRDDPAALCLISTSERAGPGMRLEAGAPDLVPDPLWAGLPAGAQPMPGGRLYLYGEDGGDFGIGEVRDGESAWQLDAAAAFGPGITFGSAAFSLYLEDEDAYLLHSELKPDGESESVDLATNRITALEGGTGARLWSAPGTDCNDQFDTGPHKLKDGAWLGIRCLTSGKALFDDGDIASFDGLDVVIEGYDLLTGESKWQLEAGADEDLVTGPAAANSGEDLSQRIELNDKPVLLDVASGKTSPVPVVAAEEAVQHVCFIEGSYEFWRASHPGGKAPTERSGGYLATPCAGGEGLPPSLAAVRDAGVGADGAFLIAYEGRLTAYKAPEEDAA